jgi:hypothetical protein
MKNDKLESVSKRAGCGIIKCYSDIFFSSFFKINFSQEIGCPDLYFNRKLLVRESKD